MERNPVLLTSMAAMRARWTFAGSWGSRRIRLAFLLTCLSLASCEKTMYDWYANADANSDGSLTVQEIANAMKFEDLKNDFETLRVKNHMIQWGWR